MMVDAHLNPPREPRSRDIAGNCQHRRAVQPGAADASREIGGTGPNSRYAHARNSSKVTYRGSHESGRCFARGKNKLDGTLSECLDQRQYRPTRHAENPAHSGFLQRVNDDVAVVQLVNSSSRIEDRGWKM